tara:strand:+ start:1320 stop:1448 length:129 start_codon:yes stop_codon:yes gene_type:complete
MKNIIIIILCIIFNDAVAYGLTIIAKALLMGAHYLALLPELF